MMLDKKQIWAIFLFRFKMGCKAAETTHNINNASDPGTANECTVQGWFKKFCKGDKSLEDEEWSGWPSEVDNNNWEPSFKADPFTNTWEVAKELNLDHSMVIRHLKQIEKVRKLGKWVPHEMTENQKDHHFEVSSCLILHKNNKPFLDWTVTYNKKWIFHDYRWQPAQWLDQDDAPKHFPKPNLHQKKVTVTIWWSAACLIHYSFLNASESITPEKCARKSVKYTKKPQCLQSALVNREGPVLFHDNAQLHKASKVEWFGLRHSASSAIFTWPLANQLPLPSSFLKTFCRENASTTRWRQKMLSKSSSSPEAWIFMLQE